MNEKEHGDLSALLESLKEICSGVTAGSKELKDKLIADLEERLKHYFFFVRRFVTRDFESNTGMSFGKWIEFADKLSRNFDEISNAVQKLYDCHSKGELERTPERIDELEQAAKPFLDDYEDTIKSLSKLQKWLAAVPEAVKSVPPGFMSAEDKRIAIEESPEAVADLQKFIEALEEANTKILTIKKLKE